MNVKAGTLIGSGIVIALFGELKARRGMLEAAKKDLEQALDIARRIDNRWREAWIAVRLARVLASLGTHPEARISGERWVNWGCSRTCATPGFR